MHSLPQHCLPNCEDTTYTASVSATPFRRCDFKTLGLNPLCDPATDIGDDTEGGGGFENMNPPIWAEKAFEEYNDVPSYVSDKIKDNRRRYAKTTKV